MEGAPAFEALRLFVVLLGGALVVAFVTRGTALPLSVGLVIVGLAVAFVSRGAAFAVTPDLVLAILLPGLVFEAALRTPFEELRPSLLGVVLLAVPGVLILAVLVALVLAAATELTFASGFVVGAMVAATDPAAVIAIFARLRAPRRLVTLVEAESVLNDGTGIVVFSIALATLAGEGSSAGVAAFVVTIAGSAAVGTLAALGILRAIRLVNDHLVELTASVVLCYGSYIIAEEFHWSGIIAAVFAGATLGSWGRTHGLSERASETIDTVWEFIAYLVTALIFLLLGLAISLEAVAGALGPIAWAILAIVVGRAIVVYGLVGGTSRLTAGWRPNLAALPLPWLHVLFWSGLRGAVSVALALSLPASLPQRELLQGITFGIVLFTLFVQGSTADAIVRRVLRTEPASAPDPTSAPAE